MSQYITVADAPSQEKLDAAMARGRRLRSMAFVSMIRSITAVARKAFGARPATQESPAHSGQLAAG